MGAAVLEQQVDSAQEQQAVEPETTPTPQDQGDGVFLSDKLRDWLQTQTEDELAGSEKSLVRKATQARGDEFVVSREATESQTEKKRRLTMREVAAIITLALIGVTGIAEKRGHDAPPPPPSQLLLAAEQTDPVNELAFRFIAAHGISGIEIPPNLVTSIVLTQEKEMHIFDVSTGKLVKVSAQGIEGMQENGETVSKRLTEEEIQMIQGAFGRDITSDQVVALQTQPAYIRFVGQVDSDGVTSTIVKIALTPGDFPDQSGMNDNSFSVSKIAGGQSYLLLPPSSAMPSFLENLDADVMARLYAHFREVYVNAGTSQANAQG